MKRKIALLFSFLFLTGCSGVAYRNPTENMMPTISPEDMCVVNPFAYDTGEIKRFDIVVFEMPERAKKLTRSEGSVRVMMRVVGLPGEKIEIRENQVFVNDQPLDEPFEKIVDDKDRNRNFRSIVIPEGEYFVLSDNRPNSFDSRFAEYSTISKKAIYSKVVEIKRGFYSKK